MKKTLLASSLLAMTLTACGGGGKTGDDPDFTVPVVEPTAEPTPEPTAEPTPEPTPEPTAPPAVNVDGSVAITGLLVIGQTLEAVVTDANGVPADVIYTWSFGDTEVPNFTAAQYTLPANAGREGQTISVVATYTDNDGFDEAPSFTTDGVVEEAPADPVAATFGGDLTGDVTSDTPEATGTIVITDPNDGEDILVAQADEATTYGTFSVEQAGDWEYTLDTANAEVAALAEDATLTDTVPFESDDGTAGSVAITISGVAAVATSQVARVTDTSDADTGELRILLGEALTQGKIAMTVKKEASAVEGFDAFVNLSGTSTTRADAIIDMRINDINGYEFTQSGESVNATATFPSFTNDELVDIEMTWDASSASAAVAPLVTVTIDGQAVTAAAFPSESANPSAVELGLRNIQFRLGGGTALDDTASALFVDDIVVYSDTAGTVEVCSIDFEDLMVGDLLNDELALMSCSVATPTFEFHENSFQAEVVEE